MTQRKPPGERKHKRGSENRARSRQVAVRLNAAEHAALTEAAARAKATLPATLRAAFLASLGTGEPPSGDQIRAYLRAHGWHEEPPGPAGSIWHRDKHPVAVLSEDSDPGGHFRWGAVERIAKAEGRTVCEVAAEMKLGSYPAPEEKQ